jgi:hypothetical protein
VGLSEYCIVDIANVRLETLVNKFCQMMRARDAIRCQMASMVAAYRRHLNRQFDELFGEPVADGQARRREFRLGTDS